MPRKKKQFIDKKKAQTFSLIYAGEEDTDESDVESGNGSESGDAVPGIKRVLVPLEDLGKAPVDIGQRLPAAAEGPPSWLLQKMGIPEPELPVLETSKRKEVLELGFPDDGYDYTKHLREARPDRATLITSTPTTTKAGKGDKTRDGEESLFSLPGDEDGGEASSGVAEPNPSQDAPLPVDVKLVDARRLALKSELSEAEQDKYDKGSFPVPDPEQKRHRQVGTTYVSTTLAEIEQVMADIELAEEAETGDLQEDFLLLATEGADEAETEDEDDEEASWNLVRGRAAASEGSHPTDPDAIASYREEATERALELTEGRQLMEDCFDKLVDEYDTLEIGDLEEADLEQTHGHLHLGSTHIDSILDEFISEKRGKDYVAYASVDGAAPPKLGLRAEAPENEENGTDSAAPVMTKVVRFDLDDETKILNADDDLKERTRSLALRSLEAAEDESEDAEPVYVRVTDHSETWVCESVLSFASNLDNHPAVLSSSSGGKGRRLRRTPQGRIHEEEEEEEEEEAEERLAEPVLARAKGETAEEKKARKQAVKQAKREARIRKKEKKIEYKHVKLNKQQQQHQSQASIRPY